MPILIRRGGQYVRYNGKYATDIDLCDCSCDDYPPGCTCEELPDTLYAKLTKFQWVAGDGVIGTESVTWTLTLSKGCPASPVNPCGDVCVAGSSWFADGFHERSITGCNGIPYEKYMMDSVLVLTCTAGNGILRLSACYTYNALVTCPDVYQWMYPTASPNIDLTVTSCGDGKLEAIYENTSCAGLACIAKLEISDSPF